MSVIWKMRPAKSRGCDLSIDTSRKSFCIGITGREAQFASTDRRRAAYERPFSRFDSIRVRPLLARGCCPLGPKLQQITISGTVRWQSPLLRSRR